MSLNVHTLPSSDGSHGLQPSQQLDMPNQRVQEILGLLCLLWSQFDLGQFHDYCTARSKDQVLQACGEIRRNSKPLTGSQHSSLCSIHSYISSNSTDSRDSIFYATTPADPSHHVEPYTSTSLIASPYPSHQNQDSPYSQITAPSPYPEIDDNVSHVCITCRKIYKDKNGLAKHRRERCESQKVWVCPICSRRCGRKEKLKEHFTIHLVDCGTDCEFRNKEPCPKHHPKLDADAACRPHPLKIAWGCPVCESCFDSGDEWHEHEKTHGKDVRLREKREAIVPVDGWSERQLIESLLKSKHLQGAARLTSSDIWKSCRWPGEQKDPETFSNLIFALERHTLPENLDRPASKDELVNYAIQIGNSWNSSLANNTASWPQKPAVYPGIVTPLTSSSPVMSSSAQRHDTGVLLGQAAGNSAAQPNPVQVMQAGQLRELPSQPFHTVPDTGHSIQPERQRPITRPPLQEPQRPKGLFDLKNLMRGKSSASRIQEVSPPNPQPSGAPILPTVDPGYPLRHDSLARTYCDTSNRTTTQRMETPLHGDNDIYASDSLRFTQNSGEPPGEKRFSLMSVDVKLTTDADQQQPRSTPAGLFGNETAVTPFDPMSVSDEGYRFFLEEWVDPENL